MILFILINPISLMSRLQRYIPKKKRWWALIIIAAIALAVIVPRKKEQETVAAGDYDPETTPTMYTSDATSYVSDSGYTRYYIETTQWYVFDEAKEPNWKFPEGLYGEKFDNDMSVTSTFECDSAIYLSTPKLWELVGNVRISNEPGRPLPHAASVLGHGQAQDVFRLVHSYREVRPHHRGLRFRVGREDI